MQDYTSYASMRTEDTNFLFALCTRTLREVILKKAASSWTLSKSGLDPPPYFGHLWGNFCLGRLRKNITPKNTPKQPKNT